MIDNPRINAIILFTLLSLIWGSSFILIKRGLEVFSPDEVGALRVSAAALFMLPVAIIQFKGLRKDHYWKLFASGMMGVFIPSFLFAFSQTRLASSVAGIINSLTPLFTMIIGAVLFAQRFRNSAIVGILLGLAGTLMLTLSQTNGIVTGINLYTLLVVLACMFYASNLNLIKFKIQDLPALTITSISLLFVGPLALIYLFGVSDFTEKFSAHENAWRAFGFIVFLGIMSTAIAMFLFNKMVKISSPLFASSVTYFLPIVAVLWGVLDDENLYMMHYIGMAAILGGVYLANRRW